MAPPPPDLAPLFERARAGDPDAEAELYTLLYDELRAIAGRLMRSQPPDHVLQPTALLNEACMRLMSQRRLGWNDEQHFLRSAARAMRHILIDHRRGTLAGHRLPPGERIPLEDLAVAYEESSGSLLDLDAALRRLEEDDPRGAELVQLCFFGGHSVERAASILGVSARHAFRWWAAARVQLRDLLDRG